MVAAAADSIAACTYVLQDRNQICCAVLISYCKDAKYLTTLQIPFQALFLHKDIPRIRNFNFNLLARIFIFQFVVRNFIDIFGIDFLISTPTCRCSRLQKMLITLRRMSMNLAGKFPVIWKGLLWTRCWKVILQPCLSWPSFSLMWWLSVGRPWFHRCVVTKVREVTSLMGISESNITFYFVNVDW